MPDLTGKSTRPSAQGYAQVYHVITEDASLSDGAFRTHVALLRFARMGQTYVSREQLATVRGKTTATISAHLTELQELGYITRQERKELTSITNIVPIDSVSRKFDIRMSKELDTEEEYERDLNEILPLGDRGPGGSPGEDASPGAHGVLGGDSGLELRKPVKGNGKGGAKLPKSKHSVREAGSNFQSEEGGDFEEDARPRWAIPEGVEQEAFLAAVGSKFFEPKQKVAVKGILARIRAGSVLNGGVYAECERQIADITDLHVRLPNVIPLSWWELNLALAKKYRWSRWNLLNALHNRERLATHLRTSPQGLTQSSNGDTIDADDYLSTITR
jgi:hypothetical protein